MKGYAVIICRDDGSHFFSIGPAGFATLIWFQHSAALGHARGLRDHGFDAQVVKVEYSDPVILGPKRFTNTGGE